MYAFTYIYAHKLSSVSVRFLIHHYSTKKSSKPLFLKWWSLQTSKRSWYGGERSSVEWGNENSKNKLRETSYLTRCIVYLPGESVSCYELADASIDPRRKSNDTSKLIEKPMIQSALDPRDTPFRSMRWGMDERQSRCERLWWRVSLTVFLG